jgi:hypothetical protein
MIRPDGYVGFGAASFEPGEVSAWLARVGLGLEEPAGRGGAGDPA